MVEKNIFTCDFCNKQFANKTNYYKHKKYLCPIKLAQEKKKSLDAQNETKLYYEKIIENLQNELKLTKEKLELQGKELLAVLRQDVTFMRETHKKSTTTLDKSVDALTFLMTHRKNAPELKELTHEKAQDLLIRENRLYDYLLHFNQQNTLDQYIGEIILKYIKKENPEEQSVWNSDVSRLTYLIRDIVDESPTWLRDPNGAMFNAKIIMPVINEITNYLYKCLHSKNPDTVALGNQSDDEDSDTVSSSESSEDTDDEREKMKRTGDILGTIETLKSKKYRKSLSEYIASRIPLHKLDKGDKIESNKKSVKQSDQDDTKKVVNKKLSNDDTEENPKKVIKKKPVKKSSDSSDSDTEEKPKKVIKKKPVKKSSDSSDSDTYQKPRKIIRRTGVK